ncbi:hypothetical protein FV113G1_24560 [Fusobacterium varium]|nr:hypothetical protein FV113G1_24560 [Fusobacterium varium]
MEKDKIENEEEIDIYEIADIFFKRKRVFFLIISIIFVISVILGYFHYKSRKNILDIKFHIRKEKIVSDKLFKESGLIFPQLNIENISQYIKQDKIQKDNFIIEDVKEYDLGSNIIEIRNLKKENIMYSLKSENGEKLFNEKDNILFEINKYITERIEKIIIAEEKNIIKNIEVLSLEAAKTTDIIRKKELKKFMDKDLEYLKILTGLKLQRKYENMIEVDSIIMEEKDNFISKFLMINFCGIILGIIVIFLYEFWEKYTLKNMLKIDRIK